MRESARWLRSPLIKIVGGIAALVARAPNFAFPPQTTQSKAFLGLGCLPPNPPIKGGFRINARANWMRESGVAPWAVLVDARRMNRSAASDARGACVHAVVTTRLAAGNEPLRCERYQEGAFARSPRDQCFHAVCATRVAADNEPLRCERRQEITFPCSPGEKSVPDLAAASGIRT